VNGYESAGVRAVLVRGRATLRRAAAAVFPTAGRETPAVSASVAGRVAERMVSGKRVFLDVAPDEAGFVQPLGSE
jgi:hypothetical protein